MKETKAKFQVGDIVHYYNNNVRIVHVSSQLYIYQHLSTGIESSETHSRMEFVGTLKPREVTITKEKLKTAWDIMCTCPKNDDFNTLCKELGL